MYIQLTTRCNMTCAHCCFSATREGEDMSRETFLAALEYAGTHGEMITLGGGEPTVHPQFFDFLGLALAHNALHGASPLLVVTNGKRKDAALKLAAMAKQGMLYVELSQDDYHDPIAKEVVVAFTPTRNRSYGYSEERSTDYRGIRDTSDRLIAVGRAVVENLGGEDGCCCEDLLVAPDGTFYSCGCKHTAMGTLDNPQIPDDYDPEMGHYMNTLKEAA